MYVEGLLATVAGGAAHLSEDSLRRRASWGTRSAGSRSASVRAPRTAHPRPSGAGEEIRAGAFPVRLPALLALADRVGDREALARGIVAKRLHDPIVRLKELSGQGTTHPRVLAEPFGFEQRPSEAPDRDTRLRLGCG